MMNDEFWRILTEMNVLCLIFCNQVDESSRQREEINGLLSQVCDLQKRVQKYSHENDDLTANLRVYQVRIHSHSIIIQIKLWLAFKTNWVPEIGFGSVRSSRSHNACPSVSPFSDKMYRAFNSSSFSLRPVSGLYKLCLSPNSPTILLHRTDGA